MTNKIVTTDDDRKALLRCYECFDDGQGTDVKRPILDRLVGIGWLGYVGHGRWEITSEGFAAMENKP